MKKIKQADYFTEIKEIYAFSAYNEKFGDHLLGDTLQNGLFMPYIYYSREKAESMLDGLAEAIGKSTDKTVSLVKFYKVEVLKSIEIKKEDENGK